MGSKTASLVMGTLVGMELLTYSCERFLVHDHSTEASVHTIWTLFVVLIVQIGLVMLVAWGVYVRESALISFTMVFMSYLTWWIHSIFHADEHLLQRWEWFRHAQEEHKLHHDQPDVNHGIISHFSDQWLGTYQAPSTRS